MLRGTFLCDLVYLEECNPDNIMSGTRELINFSKRKAIFEIISQVLYFRDQPYTFEVRALLAWREQIRFLILLVRLCEQLATRCLV